MKILFTTPALTPKHGGFRVLVEVANRLLKFGHEVTLHAQSHETSCDWLTIDPAIHFQKDYNPQGFDLLIIGSPHSIHLVDRADCPPRVVIYQQMMEHLFKPNDREWWKKCEAFYSSRHPTICIAEWNVPQLRKYKPARAPIYCIGCGVNLDDFPIENVPKDGKTVLVEGWECGNASKDVDHIGPKVAARLREQGFRILAYSGKPLRTMPEAVDEYYQSPDLATLNSLYRRATILIKASKYDNLACAPKEAMTKGTVTARAIISGDDDLTDQNSRRVGYDETALYYAASELMNNPKERELLAANCLAHVQKFTWDYYMPKYNEALMSDSEQAARTVIVSIIYDEPEWKQTKASVEAAGVPVVYVARDPRGVGSLSEAVNRGFRDAIAKHPKAEFIWFVTNVTFSESTLASLESCLDSDKKVAAAHPAFESDHAFCRPKPGGTRDVVPFVEITAPLVRVSAFKEVGPLDEKMPYWGQDLAWGYEARKLGYTILVDHQAALGHVYIRNNRFGHDVTNRRKQLRRVSDKSTRARLVELYGENWKETLGI